MKALAKNFLRLLLPSLLMVWAGCTSPQRKLPFLGNPVVNGQNSVYPVIAPFRFTDQAGNVVTNGLLRDKIYVADFIFLSCPSICPKMTQQMYRAYLPYASDPRVAFLSHTIDPDRDSIPRLRAHAQSLGVSADKWHFVTGNGDSIRQLAEHSYFSAAYPDSTAPGGFTHSGALLLIDRQGHIRGVYNGTQEQETQRLISDIKVLLKEQFKQ